MDPEGLLVVRVDVAGGGFDLGLVGGGYGVEYLGHVDALEGGGVLEERTVGIEDSGVGDGVGGVGKSIDGGIMRWVMKSHAAHIVCHSSSVGMLNGERFSVPEALSDESGAKRNGGRSSSHNE